SSALLARQPSNARCAASIARSVSASPALGTVAITSPVAGLRTGSVPPSPGPSHSPLMKSRSRRRSISRSAKFVIEVSSIRAGRRRPLQRRVSLELVDKIRSRVDEQRRVNAYRDEQGAGVKIRPGSRRVGSQNAGGLAGLAHTGDPLL